MSRRRTAVVGDRQVPPAPLWGGEGQVEHRGAQQLAHLLENDAHGRGVGRVHRPEVSDELVQALGVVLLGLQPAVGPVGEGQAHEQPGDDGQGGGLGPGGGERQDRDRGEDDRRHDRKGQRLQELAALGRDAEQAHEHGDREVARDLCAEQADQQGQPQRRVGRLPAGHEVDGEADDAHLEQPHRQVEQPLDRSLAAQDEGVGGGGHGSGDRVTERADQDGADRERQLHQSDPVRLAPELEVDREVEREDVGRDQEVPRQVPGGGERVAAGGVDHGEAGRREREAVGHDSRLASRRCLLHCAHPCGFRRVWRFP